MRAVILTMMLMFVAFLGNSQEIQVTRVKKVCNADVFANQTGTLIKQEYNDLVEINKCKISLVHLTNLKDNKDMHTLRFEFVMCNVIANLDEDEIDDMLKYLNDIKNTHIKTKPKKYTELMFKSRSGFEFGCYFEDDKWKFYMRTETLEKCIVPIDIKMDKSEFFILVSAIEQAKGNL